MTTVDLRSRIREVDDFPTPGVGFKDITPLLADPVALRQTIADLSTWVAAKDADLVLGAEARGFILGAAVAAEAGVGFVPARRPGKLPPETVGATYVLEYGENVLEVHPDLIPPGARVVIHDDVLATGGTVEAIRGLVRAARRRGRRCVLHHRADVPGRPRPPGRARRALADRVLSDSSIEGGAAGPRLTPCARDGRLPAGTPMQRRCDAAAADQRRQSGRPALARLAELVLLPPLDAEGAPRGGARPGAREVPGVGAVRHGQGRVGSSSP